MIWKLLAVVLVVLFVAMLVWFARRGGNSRDNAPDGATTNPPVNGTGTWT